MTAKTIYMKTSLQIPWLTSLPSTLRANKDMKMKFSADKIYYTDLYINGMLTSIGLNHEMYPDCAKKMAGNWVFFLCERPLTEIYPFILN